MRDDLSFEESPFVTRRSTARSKPALVLLVAAVTALISAAVSAAAILAPAPAAAVPLVVLICVGCPLFASWEVPVAVAALRAKRAGGDAVATLRRALDRLPETDHPLGL